MGLEEGRTFHEDEYADDGEGAHDLDEDIDDVARFSLVGAGEDEKEEHEALDYQLSYCLG